MAKRKRGLKVGQVKKTVRKINGKRRVCYVKKMSRRRYKVSLDRNFRTTKKRK